MIAAAAALAAAGCDRDQAAPRSAPPPPSAAEGAAADPADSPPPPSAPPLAYPSSRCGDCHGKMYEEWRASAHARALSSPIYAAMRGRAGDGACDRCHAPLAALLGSDDLAAREGVTCEVCHNIKEVEVTRSGAGFALTLEDKVKYGPLCDAEDHYFHRMGCSPLHKQAELCAACHVYYRELPGGDALPVFTEYEEWKEGPAGKKGAACQSCHMPGAVAEVAMGAGERPSVGHHGLLGSSSDLRARALQGWATVRRKRDRLVIDAKVKNGGAGHSVPTGLPARRVVLRASVLAGDAVLASDEHRFGRFLVDDSGAEVPFFRATRVAADERIPPGETARVRLEVAADAGDEIRIDLVWQAVDPRIAAQLEIEPEPEVHLLGARTPLPRSGAAILELTR